MASKQSKSARIIGSAEFGAYMHRNNGGKIRMAAYTSVNKPLKTDAADETKRIAHRRFRIIEDEKPELDGDKFYNKDVWTEQKEVDDDTMPEHSSGEYGNPSSNYHQPQGGNELTPLQVLKNFVDNLAADLRQSKNRELNIGIIAVAALFLAIGCIVWLSTL